MRTVAATRQTPLADLTSVPTGYNWLVYCRENKLLTASEWALAAILVTLGQGQNIMLTVTGMADITRMTRKTVAKAIDGLVAKGLMVVKATGRNNAVVYRLTLPSRVNEAQQLSKSDPAAESMRHSSRVNETHNIEHEDEEVDQERHQHADGGVASASSTPSGENRAKGSTRPTSTRARKDSSAKDDHPALEEYVADLEECRDELARRLSVDPGSITIKPLAKQWREMSIRNGEQAGVSAAIKEFPADDPMWSMCASKANPVGFLVFAVEQYVQGNDVTTHYRRPAAEQPVVIDPRVLADKVADRVLAEETVRYYQGGDFGVEREALIEAMKLLEADDRFFVYESYGKVRGGWRVDPRVAS